ncbi:MAG: hypothetical protein IJH57_01545 [Mogibacterium sp.]|nr:hypothetical protein [Mogibacterium sp.]
MKSIWPVVLAVIIIIGGVVFFAVSRSSDKDVDVSDNESIETEQIDLEDIDPDGDGEVDPEVADELDLDEEYDDTNEYDEQAMEKVDNGVYFKEEEEGAKLTFKKVKQDEFFGKWKVTSGQSLQLFGELRLEILENGRWKGSFGDEDVKGSWKFTDGSLYLNGEFRDYKLYFTKDGKLLLLDDRDGELDVPLVAVLTKA